MQARWAITATLVISVSGCAHTAEPPAPEPPPAEQSNAQLARFLPVLADFPGPSWDVELAVGAQGRTPGPNIDPQTAVEPAGCADIPFQRSDLVAAAADGIVQNGIAGNAGEAAVRIMREHPDTDLIAESVAWAKRCREYREIFPSTGPADPPSSDPTAVSVLPPTQVGGVEVTRIHLTDNRAHRYQGQGTRESVVELARVRGLVVAGYRHDRDQEAAAVLALTIKRLSAGEPSSKPLSDKADTSTLSTRTDKKLQPLLPSAQDVPAGRTVLQSSPIIRDGTEDGETTAVCARVPFEDIVGWRSDLNRHFRQIASVSQKRTVNDRNDIDTVTLGTENPGASVIDETAKWANECGFEILPTTQLDGTDAAISVHIKGDPRSRTDYTASLLRVRGLLVITKPALNRQDSQLARQTVDNLRRAHFDTPPTGPDQPPQASDPNTPRPGDVKFPPPNTEATTKLDRISEGTLVNPEPYHFGSYLPGDIPTRSSDDYLHFRSPTGAITCTWRKYTLSCDVPQGTYPRTPKPADPQGRWQDSVVNFGWAGLRNGIAAQDPIVYAESTVLPYGHTIRLEEDTECLMNPDGLTCIDYSKRIGFHLSRGDLTPLAATNALTVDTRPS